MTKKYEFVVTCIIALAMSANDLLCDNQYIDYLNESVTNFQFHSENHNQEELEKFFDDNYKWLNDSYGMEFVRCYLENGYYLKNKK